MSIKDQDSVDAIGIDEHGFVVLTIADHLQWGDDHLVCLQRKINLYLAFLESGNVFDDYSNSRGREFKINLVCKYELTDSADKFLYQCSNIIKQAGFRFGYDIYT